MKRPLPILLPLLLLVACEESTGPAGTYYDPWMVMDASELAPGRGLVVKRTLTHLHSPYSHDACDGDPFIDGVRNEPCLDDVRHGMCATAQDVVFMSDHASLFADHEFPDVLLYRPEAGDDLVLRGGKPVANQVRCPDGRTVLVMAGTETAFMPLGLEEHVAEATEVRHAVYGTKDATSIQILKDHGAKVFIMHTEEWPVQEVVDFALDGLEVYNLHFNMVDEANKLAELMIAMILEDGPTAEAEVALTVVFSENTTALATWAKALQTKRLPGILATDAHQNVAGEIIPDGERFDSFRRLMRWFSNHVLVRPDADDREIKDALARGRHYGAFEVLGYPVGFDFRAEKGEVVYEMGDAAPVGATLHVTVPEVWRLDPAAEAPEITARILRAGDGVWEELAAGPDDLAYTVTAPGAYRAEIRMTPYHLREWLGPDPDAHLDEKVWIYANPIYVDTP
jgi:hypothetical protein